MCVSLPKVDKARKGGNILSRYCLQPRNLANIHEPILMWQNRLECLCLESLSSRVYYCLGANPTRLFWSEIMKSLSHFVIISIVFVGALYRSTLQNK
jgi:hypothetical protein